MNEMQKIEARLANTEKALFATMTVLQDLQPPYAQESLSMILRDYFDANTSLGFEAKPEFISNT